MKRFRLSQRQVLVLLTKSLLEIDGGPGGTRTPNQAVMRRRLPKLHMGSFGIIWVELIESIDKFSFTGFHRRKGAEPFLTDIVAQRAAQNGARKWREHAS